MADGRSAETGAILCEEQIALILKELRMLRESTDRRVDKLEEMISARDRSVSELRSRVEADGENIDLLFELLRSLAREKGIKKKRGVAVPKEDFYREAEERGISRRRALRELSRADVIVRAGGKNTVVCKIEGRATRIILVKGELLCRA